MKTVLICIFLLVGTIFAEEVHHPDHHDEHGNEAHFDPHSEASHKPYHRDLSDHEHHEDDDQHHDSKYDHEAFLGKEDSEKFDQMSPEESKQKLGLIVDKIDTNNDGKITEEELQKWIHEVGMKRMRNETHKHFKEMEPENGKLPWKKYEERYYLKPEDRKPEEAKEYNDKVEMDRKKWKLADTDGDGFLSEAEYLAFIHPEEVPHMRDFVVEDALSTVDTNKDGQISEDEYLRSYWEPTKDDPKEPDYLKQERETFANHWDKNKDGRLDRDEVAEWLVPKDYDHSVSEAQHLIREADTSKDGVLTKDEILNKHELFAGSQATDYGNAMSHEEL